MASSSCTTLVLAFFGSYSCTLTDRTFILFCLRRLCYTAAAQVADDHALAAAIATQDSQLSLTASQSQAARGSSSSTTLQSLSRSSKPIPQWSAKTAPGPSLGAGKL